jgi:hypothetical protein
VAEARGSLRLGSIQWWEAARWQCRIDLATRVDQHVGRIRMKSAGKTIALFVGIAIFGLVVIGLLIEGGTLPEARVVRGEKLRSNAVSEISEAIDLEDGEKIKFYYTDSPVSYDSGYVVTDRRVVSYEAVEDEMVVYSCTYEEIQDIEVQKAESWLEFTVVMIRVAPPKDSFMIQLSPNEAGDTLAVEYIRARLEKPAGDDKAVPGDSPPPE